MDQSEADRKALEDFVVGNADLEKLEAMLDRFNIFEAVGMSRQEIRHSRFLAFLLDPNQPHGLGDAFLKRFLQSAVSRLSSPVVTQIELSLWNLDSVTVQREWNHVDIFLLDDTNRLAVIIENKIGTSERSGQLKRYYDLVCEQYPQYRILAIYLTPNGDEPSHAKYMPLDYGTVCQILDEVNLSKSSVMEPDAAVLIRHYTDMMRRNIVGDSETARLAQQIYQKHQRAIDLIYENRFAQQMIVRKLLLQLISQEDSLILDKVETQYPEEWVSFWRQEWAEPSLMVSDKRSWTGTTRTLLLIFCNYANSLFLIMQIGPGDKATRARLLTMAQKHATLFGDAPQDLKSFVTTIFARPMLTSEAYKEQATNIEREAEIRKNWGDFLENDLPRIDAALKAEEWIWEDNSEPAPE